jgi:hypothetical protein
MLGILIPADIRDVIAYLSGQKPKVIKTKQTSTEKNRKTSSKFLLTESYSPRPGFY